MNSARATALEALRTAPSPFASSFAPAPFANPLPDVPAINGAVVEALRDRLTHLGETGIRPGGALLVGQAGSGKTHLLGLLRSRLSCHESLCSFVHVQPILDARHPARHLLSEIVSSLMERSSPTDATAQLKRVVARTARAYMESTVDERRGESRGTALMREHLARLGWETQWSALVQRARQWIVGRDPGADAEVLSVLLEFAVPRKQRAVVQWLRGELPDEEDMALLGTRTAPPVEPDQREAHAVRTLGGLCRILVFDRPMLVCFDQLEGTSTADQWAALDRSIALLMKQPAPLLVVCCARGDWWMRAREKLSSEVVGALEGHRLELEGCDRERSWQLVKCRLAALNVTEAPSAFPFDEGPDRDGLDREFSQGHLSPRLVLQKANRVWQQVLTGEVARTREERPLEVLSALHRKKVEAIESSEGRHPPSDVRLRAALDLALQAPAPGGGPAWKAALTGKKAGVDRAASVVTGRGIVRVGFLVNVERHHSSVGAHLKRGLDVLASGAIDRLVLVRDARVPLPDPPRWPATNALRLRLRRAHGVELVLAGAQLLHWYALVAVASAVNAGDVERTGADGNLATLGSADLMLLVSQLDLLASLRSGLEAAPAT